MRRLMTLASLAASLSAGFVSAQSPGTGPLAATQSAVAARPSPRPADASPRASSKLPVRRIVLYKNGVGFFEHVGRIAGDQSVSIDFTSAQLDDALKSLTVLDLNGGKVTGVSYNSEAPLGQRLGALRLPVGAQTTRRELLDALRGARVEVRGPAGAISGRLLSVERRTRQLGQGTMEIDEVSVVTESGEVRAVELSAAVGVQLLESDLNERLRQYLTLVAAARDRDVRRMTIATTGTGSRSLYVSYMSEVPVWKSTYRLVLPTDPKRKPLLQGWAIVDNTVGEDWDRVELSLVSGVPQSFVQQLSQPLYVQRPVVPLPQGLVLTPTTHESTLRPGRGGVRGRVTDGQGGFLQGVRVQLVDGTGATVGEASSGADGSYGISPVSPGRYRLECSLPGFRSQVLEGVDVEAGTEVELNIILGLAAVAESAMVQAAPRRGRTGVLADAPSGVVGGVAGGLVGGLPEAAPAPPREAVSAGLSSIVAAAQGRELGDLFEYKVSEPVTIRKNQSALVPILQAEIEAERVSTYRAGERISRPRRAVWLTNASTLTLDAGTVSVLDADAFAGEAVIEALKPGERRLMSYGADLGVVIDVPPAESGRRLVRARVAGGVLVQQAELCDRSTYTLRNDDTTPRMVVVEHPFRPGWKLAPGVEASETSASFYRFRVPVAARTTRTLALAESRVVDSSFQVTNITADQIAVLVNGQVLDGAAEQRLREIVDRQAAVAALEAVGAETENEIEGIRADQERLRENLKALKGSAEEKRLVERYTRELNAQEDRMDALRRETKESEAKLRAARLELDALVRSLAFDVLGRGASQCGVPTSR